jgi:DNA-binding transcriptional ArsR family regulator
MHLSPIDKTLAALSDPTRRRVVDMLKKKAHRAGELSSAFGVTAPAMSRHLRILRKSGLIEEEVSAEDDARVRVYRLRRAPFAALEKWLDDVAEFWGDQLGSLKEHAEAKAKSASKKGKS